MARARAKPSASRPSARTGCGQQGSSSTRGSASRQTLALISDVPPSPQPIATCTCAPEAHVEQACRIADAAKARAHLQLAVHLRQACGKLADRDLAPAFQDAHAPTRARQPRGRDPAAIA